MLDKLRTDVRNLDLKELRELYNYVGSLLGPAVVYQQKPAKCSCNRCREGGEGHGLYWYAYFTYKGKTHCIYVGKEKREIDPLIELEKKKSRESIQRRSK